MSNLKTVEFANGSVLESVGVGAFMNCKSLTGIVLPDTVKEIEMGAFSGCSAITSFVVGKEVTSLEAGSFILVAINWRKRVEAGNTVYSSQMAYCLVSKEQCWWHIRKGVRVPAIQCRHR